MVIITRIIPSLVYNGFKIEDRENYVKSYTFKLDELQNGDLVFAQTTIIPNDFMVGFIHEVKDDYVIIREIGSKRLCNYSNESFMKINKEKLGYEILEGIQYKIYEKVQKAINKYKKYSDRFHSLNFNDNKCTLNLRQMFSNDITKTIEFIYSSKTTIKEIGNLLK